eukprot:2010081-Amphidinium_carterae.1
MALKKCMALRYVTPMGRHPPQNKQTTRNTAKRCLAENSNFRVARRLFGNRSGAESYFKWKVTNPLPFK